MKPIRVVLHTHKDFSMGTGIDEPSEILFDSDSEEDKSTLNLISKERSQQIDLFNRPRLRSIWLSEQDGKLVIEFDAYDPKEFG